MKTLIPLLLLFTLTASAQISLNPLQKHIRDITHVKDSIIVEKKHQILSIEADSVLITLPDTAMLNADWGLFQQAGYGYQPDEVQYSLDLRFHQNGTLFFSDSIRIRNYFIYEQQITPDSSVFLHRDTMYVTKTFNINQPTIDFMMHKGHRCWLVYITHVNEFWIYKREEL